MEKIQYERFRQHSCKTVFRVVWVNFTHTHTFGKREQSTQAHTNTDKETDKQYTGAKYNANSSVCLLLLELNKIDECACKT